MLEAFGVFVELVIVACGLLFEGALLLGRKFSGRSGRYDANRSGDG